MDMNGYALEAMAHERLNDLRVAAAMHALGAARRTSLRVVVGRALVRLGERLLSDVRPLRVPA